MRYAALFALTLSCCLLACSDKTQLVVAIDSDLEIPGQLETIVVRTRALGAVEESRQPLGMLAEGALPRVGRWPLPLSFGVIRPPTGDGVDLRLDVVDAHGNTKLTIRAVTGFVEGKSLLLPIFIPRSCLSQTCGEDETCSVHGCVDVHIDPLTLTEAREGEAPAADVFDNDAGARADASEPTDAKPTDATVADAAQDPVDAGTVADASDVGGMDATDATWVDSGTPSDVGLEDARPADGSATDAMPPDSAPTDAGDPCAATEVCDGLDNNCNGDFDEGSTCTGWIDHCGVLADETWTADHPHRLTCPVQIPPNVVVRIEPGAYANFAFRLQVDGTLIASGTPLLPIHLRGGSLTGIGSVESRFTRWIAFDTITLAGPQNGTWERQPMFIVEDSTLDGVKIRSSTTRLTRTRVLGGTQDLVAPSIVEESTFDAGAALATSPAPGSIEDDPGLVHVRGCTFTPASATYTAYGDDLITDNVFRTVGVALSVRQISSGPILRRNDFTDSNSEHVRVESSTYIDARENYWGPRTTSELTTGTANLTRIHDRSDDFALGVVDTARFSTQPLANTEAPLLSCAAPNLTVGPTQTYATGVRAEPLAIAPDGHDWVAALVEVGTWARLVSVRTSTTSVTFETPVDIDTTTDKQAALSAAFAPSASGDQVVVWSGPGGSQSSRLDTSSTPYWESARDLGQLHTADLASDGRGHLIAAGSMPGGARELALQESFDDGVGWMLRSTGINYTASPRIATDGSGTWMVVYEGASAEIYVIVSVDDGQNFGAPTLVTRSNVALPSIPWDFDPRIATDGLGTWVVSWVRLHHKLLATRSTDGGQTWSPASFIHQSYLWNEGLGFDGRRWLAVASSQRYSSRDVRVRLGWSEDVTRWQDPIELWEDPTAEEVQATLGAGSAGGLVLWSSRASSTSPWILRSSRVLACGP